MNGNYVVGSLLGGLGAVTLGEGTAGRTGNVNSTNSLVGSTTGPTFSEQDAGGLRIQPLANGNYVAVFPNWDNGSIVDAGAVALGDGTNGITGVVSPVNSLVGSSPMDYVGGRGICDTTHFSDGSFAVVSSFWDEQAIADVGAVTFSDGTSLATGPVSSANSVVGSQTLDRIGEGTYSVLLPENSCLTRTRIFEASPGNYLIGSPFWNNGMASDSGALTFVGSGQTSGVVSAANSLLGTSNLDRVGDNVHVLENGNYVATSPGWDNGATGDVGAATFGSGASGVVGLITSTNSLIGTTAGDAVGDMGVYELIGSNYVVASNVWNDGTTTDAGAMTFGNGLTGVAGAVSAGNSLLGTEGLGIENEFANLSPFARDDVNGYFAATFLSDKSSGFGHGGRVLVGSQTDGVAAGNLQAILSAGTLSITDTGNGFAGVDNDLTISVSGSDLIVSDPAQQFQVTSAGTLSIDGHTLTVPSASVSSVQIASRGGADSITIDFSGSVTNLPIHVDGQNPFRNDVAAELTFLGNASVITTLNVDDVVNTGTIAATDGTLSTTIGFAGIESIVLEETSLGGSLNVGGQDVTIDASFADSLGSSTVLGDGTLTATNGLSLPMSSVLEGTGTIIGDFVNQGEVLASDSGIVFESVVSGEGSFAGDVTFLGGTQFGNSPALIDVDGNAIFGPLNVHQIELGGLIKGAEYDAIVSTGTVELSGTLEVLLIDGYLPTSGDSFSIILANSLSGTFSDLILPTLPGQLEWTVNYQSHSLRLEVGDLRPDYVGMYRGNKFLLDANGSRNWNPGVDWNIIFGRAGVTPLVGDWDGDGFDNIGFRSGSRFILDINGNGQWDGPTVDANIAFGQSGDIPVIGDWDGDGVDNIGLRRGSRFLLDVSGNGAWDGPVADANIGFGLDTDQPVIGDWNGDGIDDIGVRRINRFILDTNGNYQWDGPTTDTNTAFGQPGDLPLIGDWDGDGADNLGLRRGRNFVLDVNGNQSWDGPAIDANFGFGQTTDLPLAGKWPEPISVGSSLQFNLNDQTQRGDGYLVDSRLTQQELTKSLRIEPLVILHEGTDFDVAQAHLGDVAKIADSTAAYLRSDAVRDFSIAAATRYGESGEEMKCVYDRIAIDLALELMFAL